MNIKITYPNGEQTETTYDEMIKKAKYTLLYFYPKDNTPGCSREASDFNSLKEDFEKL